MDLSFNDSYRDNSTYTYNFTCNNGPGGVDTSPYYQAAVYIMYCFIFLLALAGNSLVCHVVKSCPHMRTVTNYYIVNLAVGDILMALFCVPFSSVSTLLLQYWPFGAEMCQIVSYSQVSITLHLHRKPKYSVDCLKLVLSTVFVIFDVIDAVPMKISLFWDVGAMHVMCLRV
jgi:hypothetical protein